MNKQLLAISIGPVQDFIATARKTRDLWFGSHVLSEISKAAARVLKEEGELIYPSFSKDEDWDDINNNAANKILIQLDQNLDARSLAEKAKRAAIQRWQEFAEEALAQAQKSSGRVIDMELWEEQVRGEDVIEFYAAWVPIRGTYAEARKRVDRLLAGRKNLRDFQPAKGRFGKIKSSLDGARESVFQDDTMVGFPTKKSDGKMIKEREHLDAIGLVKRYGGQSRPYLSVIQLAVDPWIRGIIRSKDVVVQERWEQVKNLCEKTKIAEPISPNSYPYFPYDGSLFFPSRLEALAAEKGLTQEITPLKEKLKKLYQRVQQPHPYMAVLSADGDHMGQTLSMIKDMKGHQLFSQALSRFAREARNIVENSRENFTGVLVYSGGDDVLAFLPMDWALDVARKMHDYFEEITGEVLQRLSLEKTVKPTLSVGIAIGHCLEPLEDLLNMARAAEKEAKGTERNGLAIFLQTRNGGEPLRIRERWDQDPDRKINEKVELFLNQELSHKTPYDLRQLAGTYGPKRESPWPPKELIQADAERLLTRKKGRDGEKIDESHLHRLLQEVQSLKDLYHLSDSLLLASHLARSWRQSGRTGKEKI